MLVLILHKQKTMRFSTKQKQVIEYLKSDSFQQREDAQSSQGSVPLFIEMIQEGLITTGSQEGIILKGQNPTTKTFYLIKERAFVDGFMRKKKAQAFVQKFNEQTDKIAFIVYRNPTPDFLKIWESDDLYKDIPKIVVTITGSSKKSLADIEDDKMHDATRIPLVVPDTWDYEGLQDISDDVEVVVIIDPKYGRHAAGNHGLHHDIIKILKKI
jgi:hypothetical protein